MTSTVARAILTATPDNPCEITQDRYERIREEMPEILEIGQDRNRSLETMPVSVMTFATMMPKVIRAIALTR